MTELITKSFATQCLAFPSRVDKALAEVETIEQAKDLLDRASAMKTYAERLKAGIEIEKPIAIGVLKIKAKIGEMMPAKPPKETGAMKGKKGTTAGVVPFNPSVLSAYRKIAKNKDKLEEYSAAAEDVPTQGEFLKWLKGDSGEKLAEKKAEIEAEIEAAIKHTPTATQADAIEWLEAADDFDLLLTDPPYSTDVDDINAFAESWLPLALSKMKPTGRAFVCVGAYPAELLAYLSVAMPAQVLVWTYRNTLGPSPKDNYKLNWQAILYYKGPEVGPLDCPVMLEQFSVQDINAPDGRQADRYHAWQKPLELGERFIRHATAVGDTVVDPFCCTGTFLLAAGKLGRVGTGCDLSAEHLEIAEQRGCEIV